MSAFDLKLMKDKQKHFEDQQEFFNVGNEMGYFSVIHHEIMRDLINLISVALQHNKIQDEYNSIYRACVKGFFSIIEVDIYYMNIIDNYKNYSDKDDFFEKFKKTYKNISVTFGKEEIQKEYFVTKIANLRKLKIIRDDLVHPKRLEHIHQATNENFELLISCFEDYQTFITKIMSNFFIKTKIDLKRFF